MCAGATPAGSLLAGACPDIPTGGTRPTPPKATLFNGAHQINSEGRYVEVHPVDAKVERAMFLARSKIVAAPNTGNTLRLQKQTLGARSDAEIRNRVTEALAFIVAAREITILSIVVEHPQTTATVIELTYLNNVTGAELTPQFSL